MSWKKAVKNSDAKKGKPQVCQKEVEVSDPTIEVVKNLLSNENISLKNKRPHLFEGDSNLV